MMALRYCNLESELPIILLFIYKCVQFSSQYFLLIFVSQDAKNFLSIKYFLSILVCSELKCIRRYVMCKIYILIDKNSILSHLYSWICLVCKTNYYNFILQTKSYIYITGKIFAEC